MKQLKLFETEDVIKFRRKQAQQYDEFTNKSFNPVEMFESFLNDDFIASAYAKLLKQIGGL